MDKIQNKNRTHDWIWFSSVVCSHTDFHVVFVLLSSLKCGKRCLEGTQSMAVVCLSAQFSILLRVVLAVSRGERKERRIIVVVVVVLDPE